MITRTYRKRSNRAISASNDFSFLVKSFLLNATALTLNVTTVKFETYRQEASFCSTSIMCITNGCRRRTVSLPRSAAPPSSSSMISQRLGFSSISTTSTGLIHPRSDVSVPCKSMENKPVSADNNVSSAQFILMPASNHEKRTGVRPKRRRKPQKPGKTAKMNERHFVVHNYHDHADDLEVEDEEPKVEGSRKRRRGNLTESFPYKLHLVLDEIESEGLESIISWQPHGRAFSIHKPKEFESTILHKFFRQTKITSFQRQLNLYGFQRLTRGHDCGGYYHELFLRGKPFLTKRMTRTKVKGTGFKAASSPDQEPDFYKMKPLISTTAVTPSTSDMESENGSYHSEETGEEQCPAEYQPANFEPSPNVNTSVHTFSPGAMPSESQDGSQSSLLLTPQAVSCDVAALPMRSPLHPTYARKVSGETLGDAHISATGDVLSSGFSSAIGIDDDSSLLEEPRENDLMEFSMFWDPIDMEQHSLFESKVKEESIDSDRQLGELMEMLLQE